MTMRRSIFLLAAVCVIAWTTQSVLAQALPVVKVDESGVGSLDGQPVPGTVGIDPLVPAGPATLIYTLPFTVVPGDVVLLEPNSTAAPESDLIRFVNVAGTPQSLLIFYSDLPEAGEAPTLADVGVPPVAQTNVLRLDESGVEGGLQGLLPYVPTPNQPGFGLGGVSYDIVSDVPEPGTSLLLAGGLALLLRRRCR